MRRKAVGALFEKKAIIGKDGLDVATEVVARFSQEDGEVGFIMEVVGEGAPRDASADDETVVVVISLR